MEPPAGGRGSRTHSRSESSAMRCSCTRSACDTQGCWTQAVSERPAAWLVRMLTMAPATTHAHTGVPWHKVTRHRAGVLAQLASAPNSTRLVCSSVRQGTSCPTVTDAPMCAPWCEGTREPAAVTHTCFLPCTKSESEVCSLAHLASHLPFARPAAGGKNVAAYQGMLVSVSVPWRWAPDRPRNGPGGPVLI